MQEQGGPPGQGRPIGAGPGGIYIGIGGNLPHPVFGPPRRTLEAALRALAEPGDIAVARVSPWYRTAPVPESDQPWFVNAVAELASELGPDEVLARLHGVEARFGRVRGERNSARRIDLDLVDYRGAVSGRDFNGLAVVPHPRCGARAFVLLPLRDLVPDWRHPATGAAIDGLVAALDPAQRAERLPD